VLQAEGYLPEPRRQDRVIGGFSAGAYGAMNIALHRLGDFADVQAWSGYFTQTRTAVFAHAGPAALAYNSPLDYVTHLAHELAVDPLRAYLFVGRADSSSSQLLPMVRALRARGADVRYRLYPGGHDWSVWYPSSARCRPGLLGHQPPTDPCLDTPRQPGGEPQLRAARADGWSASC